MGLGRGCGASTQVRLWPEGGEPCGRVRVWSCPSNVLSCPGASLPAGPWIVCCAQGPCRDKLSLGDSRAEKAAGEASPELFSNPSLQPLLSSESFPEAGE